VRCCDYDDAYALVSCIFVEEVVKKIMHIVVQRQSITLAGDTAPSGLHTVDMDSTRERIATTLFNARRR
jgi:hypothetical protein